MVRTLPQSKIYIYKVILRFEKRHTLTFKVTIVNFCLDFKNVLPFKRLKKLKCY